MRFSRSSRSSDSTSPTASSGGGGGSGAGATKASPSGSSGRSARKGGTVTAAGDKADLEQLDELKKQMMKDAESLLLDKFPQRIAQLNALLKSAHFNADLTSCHAELNIPRPSVPPTSSPMVAATPAATPTATPATTPAGDHTTEPGVVVAAAAAAAAATTTGLDAGAEQVDKKSASPEPKRKRIASMSSLSPPAPAPAPPPPPPTSLAESSVVPAVTASSACGLDAPAAGVVVEGMKVMTLPCGSVPVNTTLGRLFDIVKPHILQQLEDCNLLRMWIEFLIPKVEDGNNFGVDIQEECLKEVSTIEGEVATYVDHGTRYFIARGKIIAKVAKYPYIEDFRQTVNEMDERQFFNLRLIIQELRNNYASLHDMLTKNLERIKKPRSSNAAESLY